MSDNKDKLVTISELAEIIGLIDKKTGRPLTHTLRFWESKFKQIKPTILQGNRRYYSKKDIEIIKMIYHLLKEKGLTIRGALTIMNEKRNDLDESSASSIKANYYKNKIKIKSKRILDKIKKLNGKKNTH